MLYALLYPRLSASDAVAVNSLRSRFEPDRARLVRPHVTLVFGARTIDPGDLVALCRSVATGKPPFSLAFNDVDAFEDPVDGMHKVVFMVGEGAATAKALHEALYAGPHRAEIREDVPFSAHMTVATCSTNAAARKAFDEAKSLTLPFRGTVSEVAVERLEGGALSPVATIPFARD